jgi:hypothetical protein
MNLMNISNRHIFRKIFSAMMKSLKKCGGSDAELKINSLSVHFSRLTVIISL